MRFLSETRAVCHPADRTGRHPAAERQRQVQGQQQPQPQPQGQTQQLRFVGIADLAARWRYTPQGVNKLARRRDFPAPLFTVNAGRVRAWGLSEIEDFERHHPEVTSLTQKRRKIIGYLRAVSKGQPQEGCDDAA